MPQDNHIEVAIKAAMAAGKVLMDYYGGKVQTASKESSRDIVSEVDQLAEETIIKILRAHDPAVSILTEEQGCLPGRSKQRFWLIDPLDGTVNYIHNFPFFGVSIAYIEEGVIQAGAIYAPMFDDLYYAARSIGAYKNHHTLKTLPTTLPESLFAVSFSGKNYEPAKRQDEFILLSQLNDMSRGCLRTGSAALNLAYLAEGRFNGCWGKANKYWDIGAGLLITELAGAKVAVKYLDADKKLASYLAAPESIYDELYQKTKKVLAL